MNFKENLLSTFTRLESEVYERQQRDFWKYSYKDQQLNTILQQLTKESLDTIRQTLEIHGKSNLRKAELLEAIKLEILPYIEKRLYSLNMQHYDYIQLIINEKGILPYSSVALGLIYFLRDCGIVFPMMKDDEQVVIMPIEIMNFIKDIECNELKARLQLNTEIMKAIYGLIEYYGVINYFDLLDILKNYFPQVRLDFKQLYELLIIESESVARIDSHDSYVHLSGLDVEDIDQIISEQKSKKDLMYFPINKFRAIQASSADFIEKTPHVTKLMNYLDQHFEISSDELNGVIYHIIDLIKSGRRFSEYMQVINSYFEFPSLIEVQEVVGLIQEIHNNTRMWVLKGYTPKEVGTARKTNRQNDTEVEKIPITRKRVGRNDPCPCGSGKKYKYCCINKE